MSLKDDPSLFRIPIHTKFPVTDYSEPLAWATAWVRAIHPAGPAPVYVRKRKPRDRRDEFDPEKAKLIRETKPFVGGPGWCGNVARLKP